MSAWSLHEGDAWEYLRALPDQSVDVTICDPPYCARTHAQPVGGIKRRAAIPFGAQTGEELSALVGALLRVTRRWCLAFCSLESLGLYSDAAADSWVRSGVWVKVAPQPQLSADRPAQGTEGVAIFHRPGSKRWNGGGTAAVWSFRAEMDAVHPTQKPLPLMRRLVEQFSDPGETILDPFIGSGTTGAAAIELGRNFIGCEKDPGFAAIARDRLAAASMGLSVAAYRAGQTTLFGREVGR